MVEYFEKVSHVKMYSWVRHFWMVFNHYVPSIILTLSLLHIQSRHPQQYSHDIQSVHLQIWHCYHQESKNYQMPCLILHYGRTSLKKKNLDDDDNNHGTVTRSSSVLLLSEFPTCGTVGLLVLMKEVTYYTIYPGPLSTYWSSNRAHKLFLHHQR